MVCNVFYCRLKLIYIIPDSNSSRSDNESLTSSNEGVPKERDSKPPLSGSDDTFHVSFDKPRMSSANIPRKQVSFSNQTTSPLSSSFHL